MRPHKMLKGCVVILFVAICTFSAFLPFDRYPLSLFPLAGGVSTGLAQESQQETVISVGEAVEEPSGPITGAELVQKRTLTSKTYQVGPDEYKAIISSVPLHYMDSEGNWQDIDITIERQDDGSYYAGANLVKARFPSRLGAGRGIEINIPSFQPRRPSSSRIEPSLSAGLVAAGSQDASISWQPTRLAISTGGDLGAQQISSIAVAQVSAMASGNNVRYESAFPGITEEFRVVPGGVKHSLTLSSPPDSFPVAPPPDSFLDYTVELSLSPGISLYVDEIEQRDDFVTSFAIELRRGQKEIIGYLLAPYAYEQDNPKEATAGTLAVHFDSGRAIVTVRIPLSWLAAPERVYPVVIDPTTSAQIWQDTFMSDTYATASFGDWVETYAGYDPPSRLNYGRERTLMHWSVDPIPSSSTITNAVIWLYQTYSEGNTSCNLAFYRMLNWWISYYTTWNQRYYGTPWNVAGAGGTGVDYYSVGYGFSFDGVEGAWRTFAAPGFVDWVQGWVNGTYPNWGVMLKPSLPDTYVDCDRGFLTMNYNDNDDWYAPYLEVDYTFTGGAPTTLDDNVSQTHAFPNPEHYYREATTSSSYCGSSYTNCWRGTALRPLNQSDYDLWLHTAPDFSEWRVDSRQGVGRVDYTLTRETVSTTGYPRVVRFDGTDSYNIQYMLPLAGLSPPASGTVTMGADALWAVFEIFLSSPGSWQIVVTPLEGDPDLGLAIHDPATGDYHTRDSALAISDQIGQNLAEQIEFTGSSAGFYGLVVWSNVNTGVQQKYRIEVKAPSSKTYLPVVLKNYVPPRGPFSNGGFETDSRWILSGELEYERTTAKHRSGSYSLRLGNDGQDPCLGKVPCSPAGSENCESFAVATQGFDVPGAGSPSLSFYYQIYTYDHKPLERPAADYFGVYIRDLSTSKEDLVYMDDLSWVSNYQCYNLSQKDTWQFVPPIDLGPYKGKTIEVVFKVTNGGHNFWNTWSFIDDVTCSGC
jgi:hypothetical protein